VKKRWLIVNIRPVPRKSPRLQVCFKCERAESIPSCRCIAFVLGCERVQVNLSVLMACWREEEPTSGTSVREASTGSVLSSVVMILNSIFGVGPSSVGCIAPHWLPYLSVKEMPRGLAI